QKDLESYFQSLGKKIEALNLERLVEHNTKEIAVHAAEMKLGHVIRTANPVLKDLLALHIQAAMLSGQHVHHFAEAADDPLTTDGFEITSDVAALYASVHAGELVTGIDDTTQQLIADIIEKGIEQNLGVDGTSQLLRQLFQDMSSYRSRLIATTEM